VTDSPPSSHSDPLISGPSSREEKNNNNNQPPIFAVLEYSAFQTSKGKMKSNHLDLVLDAL